MSKAKRQSPDSGDTDDEFDPETVLDAARGDELHGWHRQAALHLIKRFAYKPNDYTVDVATVETVSWKVGVRVKFAAGTYASHTHATISAREGGYEVENMTVYESGRVRFTLVPRTE